tara:strand:+ start:13184 stop:13411 length:228 start_codon:yes stop_codon:yes gene_type:complete
MKNGKLKSFRERLMETEYFNGLPKVVQKIALQKNNLNHIEHGYNVAMNIGFDKWESQSGFSFRNKEIIRELIQNQ